MLVQSYSVCTTVCNPIHVHVIKLCPILIYQTCVAFVSREGRMLLPPQDIKGCSDTVHNGAYMYMLVTINFAINAMQLPKLLSY